MYMRWFNVGIRDTHAHTEGRSWKPILKLRVVERERMKFARDGPQSPVQAHIESSEILAENTTSLCFFFHFSYLLPKRQRYVSRWVCRTMCAMNDAHTNAHAAQLKKCLICLQRPAFAPSKRHRNSFIITFYCNKQVVGIFRATRHSPAMAILLGLRIPKMKRKMVEKDRAQDRKNQKQK